MAGAIMRPLTPRERMPRRWRNGQSMQQFAGRFIKSNDRLTSFERLEIYNRQYWFRILSSFFEDYPGLRAVLGDRKFEELARAYLTRHPSASFTLRNLGSRLEKFLKAEPRWITPQKTLAMDMARIEWAAVVAFDGEARPVVTPNELLGLKPSEIRLRLQPYITLLELSHPVDDFLIAMKRDGALRGEASNAMDEQRKRPKHRSFFRLKPKVIHLAVHRSENSIYYKRLEPEAFHILQSLSKGATLERACLRAFRSAPSPVEDWPSKARKWFQNWASLGWFCRAK